MAPTLVQTSDGERRQQIALFRYGVIADLVQLPPNHRGIYELLRGKEAREYDIPGSTRRRVAAETVRGWLAAYRRGGFDALKPKIRQDVGSARSIPPRVVDLLCEVKDTHPALSIPMLIRRVRDEHADVVSSELDLPLSTVHRLLSRRGLMKRRERGPQSKDRRRFEFEEANDLWMSDVMYGPKIRVGARARRTYLIAFIDDATRLIPHATFALSEGTAAYLPVLEQAIRRRGIPKRLYVDNGSAFRSHHLSLVCAKLGIALIHARPYSPQGKGKMERWFRTVRLQLMPILETSDGLTLEAMNRALGAWVEGEYHRAPHRGLGGGTPSDRWARTSEHTRMASADVGECFLFEVKRKVGRDRTVTLDGIAFEVDAALVGETVLLRYDPSRVPAKRSLEVWHQGKRVELARRVDVLSNCFVKRHRTGDALQVDGPTEDVPQGLSMRELSEREIEEIF